MENMVYSSPLVVVSFKEDSDRSYMRHLFESLGLQVVEFEKENTVYKYCLDVFVE